MDDTSFIMSAPGALLVSIAVMFVCIPLKSTPRVPGWVIPYVAFFLGAIGFCILEGWTFKNHLIGFILGGCAVGIHQSLKQGRIGLRSVWEMNPGDNISEQRISPKYDQEESKK